MTPPQKICPKCRRANWINAQFCPTCGHAFSTQFPNAQSQPQYVAPPNWVPPPAPTAPAPAERIPAASNIPPEYHGQSTGFAIPPVQPTTPEGLPVYQQPAYSQSVSSLPDKWANLKYYLMAIGAITVLGRLVSCGMTTGGSSNDLSIVPGSLHMSNGAVTGTVKNESSRTVQYAQVEINLYNSSHHIVGSTLANVNNLEGGSQWEFTAPVMDEGATSCELKAISGQ